MGSLNEDEFGAFAAQETLDKLEEWDVNSKPNSPIREIFRYAKKYRIPQTAEEFRNYLKVTGLDNDDID